MNLLNLHEELLTKLNDSSHFAIYAGKFEEQIIPFFLEGINLKDLDIEKFLNDSMKKNYIAENFFDDVQVLNLAMLLKENNNKVKALKEILRNIDSINKYAKDGYYDDLNRYYERNKDEATRRFPEIIKKYEEKIKKSKITFESFVGILQQELIEELTLVEKNRLELKTNYTQLITDLKSKNTGLSEKIKNEKNALSFFYEIFLNVEITDLDYDLYNGEFKIYKNNSREINLFQHIQKYNVVPRDWRSILFNICDNKIPNYSGNITKKIIIEDEILSTLDISYLVAVKIALKNKTEIVDSKNKIFMPLSGGMMCEIIFTEKDNFLRNKFSGKNHYFFYEQNKDKYSRNSSEKEQIVLSQFTCAGYPVNYKIPNRWFFVEENYVIELNFHSASILNGISQPDILSSFNSAISKRIEGEKQAEEDARDAYDDSDKKRNSRF